MKTTLRASNIRSSLPALLLLVLALVSSYQWWASSDELAAARESSVELSGTVTLDSLPVTSGIFQLTRADGQSISAPITNGAFRITSIPAGEWQQSIQGPSVPNLYNKMGPTTIDSSIRSVQFGLKGTEQLKLHALSLLERSNSDQAFDPN